MTANVYNPYCSMSDRIGYCCGTCDSCKLTQNTVKTCNVCNDKLKESCFVEIPNSTIGLRDRICLTCVYKLRKTLSKDTIQDYIRDYYEELDEDGYVDKYLYVSIPWNKVKKKEFEVPDKWKHYIPKDWKYYKRRNKTSEAWKKWLKHPSL